uniref:NADH-ubiquinone oxidoreductase chain 2 n=1 Tax=Nortia carinicollis TaxID=583456 RepID=A0A5B9RSM6_9CUCU|nr:NADH dehydrogenase subunit 2 [Nortia carinicollis]QEG58667.1 NADH dehydrogenase subunit 2 [Nortia carinicollis]
MNKFNKILFFYTLMTGSLISISSYSWFSMWMGLEINLLAMIPLIYNSKNLFSSEAALKYFITQALASGILLFSIILMTNSSEFLPQNSNYWLMMMMNSALMTKVGAAPFHSWFPEVLEGMNWMNGLIMLTWQKIAPMVLLMYSVNMTVFFSSIVIFSSTIGSILGLNQISMRKIMAYSSINHIGWMIAALMNSQFTWMIYFLIYSFISVNIIFMLNYFNIFNISQISNSINMNKPLKIFFMMNFLSLGGVPPFLGFFPKWLVINELVKNNLILVSLILIILALVTLFFYLRLTISTIVISSSEFLTPSKESLSFFFILCNFFMLAGLALCVLVFNFN